MNEVEAAGNTPLHSACYEGWLEGVKLLLDMGAKMDASNNAGDRAIHWAQNMGHEEVYTYLQSIGADESQGQVLVPDHVPKVDFYFSLDSHGKYSLSINDYYRHLLMSTSGCNVLLNRLRTSSKRTAGRIILYRTENIWS